MKKSLLLKTISLIVLSGCASKEYIEVQTLDMTNKLVNYRQLVADNKKCSMTSQLIRTEKLGQNQQGLICITPETFNEKFVQWQDQCQ